MLERIPAVLRAGSRSRQPFTPDDHEELVDATLEERQGALQAELDRLTGAIEIRVPGAPAGAFPGGLVSLPPAPNAAGGAISPVRRAWIAKYDPRRAEREKHLDPLERTVDNSDVFHDFTWDRPDVAISEPWIHSWLMRGAGGGIARMDLGDLVLPLRSGWMSNDGGWLRRRTVVGVWSVESIATWPGVGADGRKTWRSEAACLPLRRFDFPVPIKETSDIDLSFDYVAAFHDRSRQALIQLSPDEAIAVVRACGLPAETLTEPDEIQLIKILQGLDLGPSTVVRKRILDGVRASAHRASVEKAARDLVVGELRRANFGVVSTETKRGLGSDLWARAIEADGRLTQVRVEVKGLSGSDPWRASLTRSEVEAARASIGSAGWQLAVVTRALRSDRRRFWFSADEVASIWTAATSDGHFTADRNRATATAQ